MKRLLKYLLFFVVTAAFWGSEPAYSMIEDITADSSFVEDTSYHASISATESQLDLPRQISIVSAPSVQGAARRTSSIHRNNTEFAKAGKVIHAGLRYFIQLRSVIVHSSLMEPSHRLLYLGRLII